MNEEQLRVIKSCEGGGGVRMSYVRDVPAV